MRICATCGGETADPAATTCLSCGAPLPPVAQLSQEPTPATPVTVTTPPTAAPPGYAPQPGQPLAYPPQYPQYPPHGAPAAPSQPMYPPYGYQGAPSQPMYPGSNYPPYPAPPTQPMYPGYTPIPNVAGPSAQRTGNRPLGLIIGLVVALAVVLLGGISVGLYALSANLSPHVAPPIPTATATQAPFANALFYDPLTQDNHKGWPSDSNGHCGFQSDGYHVANNYAQSGYYEWYCDAPLGAYSDGVVTVTADEVSGVTDEPYGIIFRQNTPTSGASGVQDYWFVIDGNSSWALFKETKDSFTRLQDYTFNAAIHGGLNEKNTMSVEFRGLTFTCKVNGVTVGQVTDTGADLGAGYTGMQVGNNVNVRFSDFAVFS